MKYKFRTILLQIIWALVSTATLNPFELGFILEWGYFSKENIHFMDKNGYPCEFIIMMKGMKSLVRDLVLLVKGSFEEKCEYRLRESYRQHSHLRAYSFHSSHATILPVPFLWPLLLSRQLCFYLLDYFPCNASRSDLADSPLTGNTSALFSSNTPPASLSIFL